MEKQSELLGLHQGGVVVKIFFVVLLAVLNGCAGNARQDPAPVIRPQKGADLCDEACESMSTKLVDSSGKVGCEVALPVPVQEGGTVECEPGAKEKKCISCGEWCVEQHANGVFWNTECIVHKISTCEEVETVCNVQ